MSFRMNWNGLGVPERHLNEHIAWDIGIEAVTRRVSAALDVPAAYCLYSRLIVDANRRPDCAELIRPESDGIVIPGNVALGAAEREARIFGIYQPYHSAANRLVCDTVTRHGRPLPVIGMHSCTPRLRLGAPRPWHIGLSTYDSEELMEALADQLRSESVNVGIHQPYDMRDYTGCSLDTHGRAHGLPQILVEIRQDLIGDDQGAQQWAELLIPAFRAVLAKRYLSSICLPEHTCL